MKPARSFLAVSLSFSFVLFSFLSFSIQTVNAQDSKIALQRGYRTGYSDGYMAGYRDVLGTSPRGYDQHTEYGKADRAYAKEFGALEDYRDGYQQGFEKGYNTGFEKRSFDATLPVEIKKRGTVAPRPIIDTDTTTEAQVKTDTVENSNVQQSVQQTTNVSTTYDQAQAQQGEKINYVTTADNQVVVVPVDSELIVELLEDVSTRDKKEGDKFQARVVSPNELNGAIIEGRIRKVQKPGKIKRRAELSLSFDQIRLSDVRWANYNAILTEVLPVKGDNIKRVDAEGTVEGKSSVKSDTVKVGASTAAGTVVGAIAGGPVGAAVGAGVGAAFGVGAVVIDRGEHINIVKGQQLRIRTVYETQIR